MSSLDRRAFLATAVAASTCALAAGQDKPAQPKPVTAAGGAAPPAESGPFKLPALPYAPEALEPSIDTETMRIHHDKHHQAYITNLNNAVKGLTIPNSVEELIAQLDKLPEDKRTAIRNNGGGHANHSLFWTILAPKGKGGEPSKELLAAIDRDLGGLEKAKDELGKAGLSRFGSGWSWLVVTPDKKLAIVSTANQDSPLMGAKWCEKPGTPILGIDVWEHAYYLHYQNRRADYLKAIWDVINWTEVSRRFAAAG